ncbi:M50 family metallopeptidase [Paenibacillus turpanensis]|uniref:M50 family metallopeptidase n=1 Tax=Paenibacillus turpanensis TaxID=2689078 RepID=UPI001FB772D7|nr:M50 family metallopeptidase [Paenibacillus turpanensis]
MINIAGIRFRFHPLFVMMAALSMLTGFFMELITLFGIVLIHELGHVAAMRGFGWRVREIQLLPFGGVAETEESGGSMPVWEEIVVALAGPAQNVLMIGLAWCLQAAGWWGAEWTAYFIQANALIALFNLLPVLPLDGGKLMQSFLSLWLQYYRALWLSVWISIIISAGVLGYGCYLWLTQGLPLNVMVIALFLIYSNYYNWRNIPYYFFRFLLGREVRVKEWIARGVVAQPIAASQDRPMKDIVRLYMRERMHFVYVFNDMGNVQKVLPEQRLTAGFMNGKPGSAVSDLFR